MKALLFFIAIFASLALHAAPLPSGPGKQVAVFVALCDNEHQGIASVPEKIGNGFVPSQNLYWGCSDALPKVLRASCDWGRPQYFSTYDGQPETVLETVVCTRADNAATVYAYAYRGDSIEACMTDFEASIASSRYDLVAYIGHNGLMDVELPEPAPAASKTDVVVLCCLSNEWFSDRVRRMGATPILMTRQFMYPAGKVFTEVLAAWLKAPRNAASIHSAAARAYAQNQGISVKAAGGVFIAPTAK